MNTQPKEILKHIFGYISDQELIHLTRVSKEWLNLIENHILHLEVIPSFEECIITRNYFYGRRYLNQQLDDNQKKLIQLVNNYTWKKHFQISNIDINKQFLLLNCCIIGNIEIIKFLSDRDTDIHTALQYSAINGHLEIVKLLLEKGADLHAGNNNALVWSAQRGHLEIVKLLLEKGADLHVHNDIALCYSAENGHIEVVKLLLENGADIRGRSDEPLRWSAENGHIDVVKLLLDKGADIHAINDYALIMSAHKGHDEIVKLLLEKGANRKVLLMNYEKFSKYLQ